MFHLFKEHVKLLVISGPEKTTNAIPKYTINTLMRWTIRLIAFNYEIEHVPRESGHRTDILSRWSNRDHTIVAERVRVQPLMVALINPSLDE